MRFPLLCAAALMCASSAFGQTPTPAPPPISQAQKAFEAGQYGDALKAIATARTAGTTSPSQDYLAGQVYLRLNQSDKAKQEFGRLAAEVDPLWKLVGQSAVAFVDNHIDQALATATEASKRVEAASMKTTATAPAPAQPTLAQKFHVLYQLGLVKAQRGDWPGAADAFERAAQLDPTFAYAQYYAGLAYSHIKRPDKVALYFDHFLTLAPNAPEHDATMSIMRTIRGR